GHRIDLHMANDPPRAWHDSLDHGYDKSTCIRANDAPRTQLGPCRQGFRHLRARNGLRPHTRLLQSPRVVSARRGTGPIRVLVRSRSRRSAPWKLAPRISASAKLARARFASRKSAAISSAPLNWAPVNIAPEKSARHRLLPERSTDERSRPERSARVPSVPPRATQMPWRFTVSASC